ncbi:zinc finger and BTB domain-containing protein 41-like [Argiope bruennichi]|uniref:zinc finger and BTB domain-containing protein 41-like n=1 Tax=Argiope bruennichi TaxID=94029 RepID=UPI002494DECA|nr:zinc finger and BTB domain-containing protein 41-like [Argiope bruennichi]
MNEVILEQETDSGLIKDSTEINSSLKSEKAEMKLIVCPKCDAHFEKRAELALHFKQFHLKKRGRPAVPVECNLCQKKFSCKKDYAIHFRDHSTKPYACPSCKKMCFLNVPHSCKKVKYEKSKRSVWEACKKVLTDKSFQQAPSEDSKYFVPKLPISKKVVFMNTFQNQMIFKNLKISSDNALIANFVPHLKGNKITNNSIVNNISCDQNSVEQLFSECKNMHDLQLDNLMNFQTAATNVTEMNNSEFFCNICDISFKEMEKYEAHYSTHLCDEFCQIREGDEELHVCNVCGKCFTELNAFQAHEFTHVNKNDLL